MAAELFHLKTTRIIDSNGIADGATLTFYDTGTLVKRAVYTTSALSVEHPNPLTVAAGAALPNIYLNEQYTYRCVVRNAAGSTIDDIDPYLGLSSLGVLYTDPGTGAVGRTESTKLTELGRSVLDFASAAAKASIAAFDGAVSAQSAFDKASDAIHQSTGSLLLPCGKYPVTQILVPYDNSTDTRGEPFHLIGAGTGEPFVVNDSTRRGTVIVGGSATLPAIVTRVKSGGSAGQSAGTLRFENFRVEHTGNSGVAAVKLGTFYGPSVMSRVDIYQQGVGDGLHVDFMATGLIELGYILGAAWNDGVGAAGTGFKLSAAIDAGLQTVHKMTSRGFAIGFQIGATGGNTVLSPTISQCEVSYCTDGFVVANAAKNAIIDNGYIEGVTSEAVIDAGRATCVRNLFAELEFTVGVTLGGNASGVQGGYFGLKPTGATGVHITADGGANGAYVANAHFRWGGEDGVNTAKGIVLDAMADPSINIVGNTFDPPGEWRGSGSGKVKDSTYSSAHGGSGAAHGSGVFGLMQRDSGGFDLIPCLSRGAVNLHVDDRVLTDAFVNGSGTLALSNASVQYLSLSAPQSVIRFSAPNLPDKTGKLLVDNGNLTLTPGTYVVGLARRIVLPAGKQAWIEYQVLPTANAPVSITSVRLLDTSFTVTELGTLEGDFDQTVFASNGRRSGEGAGAGTGCPVWWDGADWRTFYDNAVVAA